MSRFISLWELILCLARLLGLTWTTNHLHSLVIVPIIKHYCVRPYKTSILALLLKVKKSLKVKFLKLPKVFMRVKGFRNDNTWHNTVTYCQAQVQFLSPKSKSNNFSHLKCQSSVRKRPSMTFYINSKSSFFYNLKILQSNTLLKQILLWLWY